MENNVLILDCGAPQILAMAECLRKTGYHVDALCCSKGNYGYHSSMIEHKFICPDEHDKEYVPFVLNFLKEHKYDVIMPTSDVNAEFCSFYKDEIQKYTNVLIPEKEIFQKAYDKNNLTTLCREKGYPHPVTVDLRNWNCYSNEILKDFPYPGILKPNLTSGGRGMTLVKNEEELMTVYPDIHREYGECHLQQFIMPGGRQVKVEIMTDANGTPAYSSVIWKQRFYPINGGSSCCNVTIDDPEIAEICGKILQDIGWIGFADFDLIEDPLTKQLLIMEINPRTPACVRSAYKSGLDFATMIADATLGLPLRRYEYKPGKKLRHLGFEVLWFLKSPDRFKAKPSWFNFFGKDTYYQDWVRGDFGAFFWGSLNNLKKQLNPEFRKAKNGVKL